MTHALTAEERERIRELGRQTQCWYTTARLLGVCDATLDRLIRGNRRVRPSTVYRVRMALLARRCPVVQMPGCH